MILTPVKDNEEYDILHAFASAKFEFLLKYLSIEEATIVSLVMGFINGKKYSVVEVAKFLDLPIDDVKEMVKSSLTMYRDTIVKALDEQITRVLK